MCFFCSWYNQTVQYKTDCGASTCALSCSCYSLAVQDKTDCDVSTCTFCCSWCYQIVQYKTDCDVSTCAFSCSCYSLTVHYRTDCDVSTCAFSCSRYDQTVQDKKLALLNAKPENVRREAQIIAQAGLPGAVTIATNMAGRGTDIVLGGNPKGLALQVLMKLFAHYFISGQWDDPLFGFVLAHFCTSGAWLSSCLPSTSSWVSRMMPSVFCLPVSASQASTFASCMPSAPY